MKKKVSLKKMAQADVQFVSLVGRAANRIPFRVIKSDKENGMLNLSSIGKVLKGEKVPQAPAQPELVAVVVEKSDLIPQITDAMKEGGFDVTNVVENEDNTVSFIQKESAEGDELTLIRMDDNVVLVMKGFSSYASELNSFNDVVKAQGFYQGVDVACSAFRETVQKSLYSAESADDVVKKVDDTVASFGSYVRALANGLPAAAFTATDRVASVYKADKDAKDADAASEAAKVGDTATPPKAEVTVDLTVVPDDLSKKDWDALDDAGKIAHLGTVQKSETVEEPKLDVAELVRKTAEAVAAAMKPQLDSLSDKVEAVSTANAAMQEKVDSVVTKSEAISNRVGATVVNATIAADVPSGNNTQVKKAASDPRVGAFDTAMIRKQDR